MCALRGTGRWNRTTLCRARTCRLATGLSRWVLLWWAARELNPALPVKSRMLRLGANDPKSVDQVGVEPTPVGLKARCSPTELLIRPFLTEFLLFFPDHWTNLSCQWGRVESNHRALRQRVYGPPLAPANCSDPKITKAAEVSQGGFHATQYASSALWSILRVRDHVKIGQPGGALSPGFAAAELQPC